MAAPDYLLHHQWLLGCLVESPDRATAFRIEARSESDWAGVVALAVRHGIMPLLYQRLTSRAGSSAVPDRVLETLRDAFLMNGSKSALLYRQLSEVLTVLQEHKIPVMVLKGAHLAALIYEDPALRTMNDIDLLVREDDLERTAALLQNLGYAPGRIEDDEDRIGKRQHLPRMFKPVGPGIEIHWEIISPKLPFSVDIAGVWKRARPAAIAGVEARVLSPEDLLLHLCVHTASHPRDGLRLDHAPFRLGLRPLCDIAATIQHNCKDINWEQVRCRATEWRAGKCVYLSLWLAKELLRADVPVSVLECLRPRDFDERWGDLARDQVALAGADPTISGAVKCVLLPFMKLGGGSGSRVRRGKLGLLMQAAFPPREVMAEYMAKHHSVRLNLIRNYTCYLTRAIDWLPRVARLAWYCATHGRQAAFYAREIQQPLLWNWLIDAGTESRPSKAQFAAKRA